MDEDKEQFSIGENSPISERNNSSRKFVKFSFLIFGIAGLLAWNTILSDIGFFIYFIPSLDPLFIFPFLNFALNIIFQFILLFKKKLFTYKTQLLFSVTLSGILLIILPLSVISLNKDSLTNRIIASIMILFQGLLNAICQSSFFGLVSFFPIDIIVNMSTGQGIAGILMNIIQYIVIFTIGDIDKNKKQSENDTIVKKSGIIFFSISVFIIVVSLVFIILIYRNNYFKNKLILSGEHSSDNDINNIEKLINNSEHSDESLSSISSNKEVSFLDLTKILLDLNILTVILYIITFSVFPGVCLEFKLFNLDGNLKNNTIITIYNIFDTIGRLLVAFFNPTKKKIYILTLSRIILLIIMPFDFYYQYNSNSLTTNLIFILCVIFCAITNGLVTSLLFGIAPTLVPINIKGRAGSSISFYLILGIFLGTLSGIGMGKIIDSLKKK